MGSIEGKRITLKPERIPNNASIPPLFTLKDKGDTPDEKDRVKKLRTYENTDASTVIDRTLEG